MSHGCRICHADPELTPTRKCALRWGSSEGGAAPGGYARARRLARSACVEGRCGRCAKSSAVFQPRARRRRYARVAHVGRRKRHPKPARRVGGSRPHSVSKTWRLRCVLCSGKRCSEYVRCAAACSTVRPVCREITQSVLSHELRRLGPATGQRTRRRQLCNI